MEKNAILDKKKLGGRIINVGPKCVEKKMGDIIIRPVTTHEKHKRALHLHKRTNSRSESRKATTIDKGSPNQPSKCSYINQSSIDNKHRKHQTLMQCYPQFPNKKNIHDMKKYIHTNTKPN